MMVITYIEGPLLMVSHKFGDHTLKGVDPKFGGHTLKGGDPKIRGGLWGETFPSIN
jgi:hypothetical protein